MQGMCFVLLYKNHESVNDTTIMLNVRINDGVYFLIMTRDNVKKLLEHKCKCCSS